LRNSTWPIYSNKEQFARLIKDPDIQKSFLADKMNLNNKDEIDKLLQNSSHNIVFRYIRTKYFEDINSSDLINAFLGLSHPIHSWRAWRWFLGESLDKGDKEILDFENTIKDSETAYIIFGHFVKLLNKVGLKSIVILIDELEKITEIHQIKRSKYQDYLRRMIDDHSQKICFYFAIAWRQWNVLYQQTSALVRRLQSNWYTLENFSAEDTTKFIARFLSQGRTENYLKGSAKSAFPDCDPTLCPFSDDSLEAIYKSTSGKISEIIELCSKLIEFLTDNEKQYDHITIEMVDLVNKQRSISKKRYG